MKQKHRSLLLIVCILFLSCKIKNGDNNYGMISDSNMSVIFYEYYSSDLFIFDVNTKEIISSVTLPISVVYFADKWLFSDDEKLYLLTKKFYHKDQEKETIIYNIDPISAEVEIIYQSDFSYSDFYIIGDEVFLSKYNERQMDDNFIVIYNVKSGEQKEIQINFPATDIVVNNDKTIVFLIVFDDGLTYFSLYSFNLSTGEKVLLEKNIGMDFSIKNNILLYDKNGLIAYNTQTKSRESITHIKGTNYHFAKNNNLIVEIPIRHLFDNFTLFHPPDGKIERKFILTSLKDQRTEDLFSTGYRTEIIGEIIER